MVKALRMEEKHNRLECHEDGNCFVLSYINIFYSEYCLVLSNDLLDEQAK